MQHFEFEVKLPPIPQTLAEKNERTLWFISNEFQLQGYLSLFYIYSSKISLPNVNVPTVISQIKTRRKFNQRPLT